MQRAVVDLPQPDSPTRATVSPLRISNVTPLTACTTCPWLRNLFSRSTTSSSVASLPRDGTLLTGLPLLSVVLVVQVTHRQVAGDAADREQRGTHTGARRKAMFALPCVPAARGRVVDPLARARRPPLEADPPVGSKHGADQVLRVGMFRLPEDRLDGTRLDHVAA